ncbi:MAG: hypothetical protein EBR23_02110 [Planctomycetia bacterium]|nr:hypothetical protein [Planctomycetia bacterium]
MESPHAACLTAQQGDEIPVCEEADGRPQAAAVTAELREPRGAGKCGATVEVSKAAMAISGK